MEQTRTKKRKGAIPAGEILPTVWSYFYIYCWVKRANWRRVADGLALGFLGLFLLVLAGEVSLELAGRSVVHHPTWVQVLFFVVVSVLLYIKLREWGERRQQASFIDAAREVSVLLSRDPSRGTHGQLLSKLIALFHLTFERPTGIRRRKLRVTAALITDDDPEILSIVAEHPAKEESPREPLSALDGGAAFCLDGSCLVYIPRKALRHAVIQEIDDDPGDEPFSLQPQLFVDRPSSTCRSILCVPIRARGNSFGVLIFDSPRANAFRRLDFEQATFYGFALALLLLHKE